MVKRTQTIRRQLQTNCLSVFDHFVGLALKGLRENIEQEISTTLQHSLSNISPSTIIE